MIMITKLGKMVTYLQGFLSILKTSWRHVLKTSSTSIHCNKFSFSKTYSRHLTRNLQDVLEGKKLFCWRHPEDVFKTCLEDVFKMFCKEVKGLLWISISNKSKCVSSKSVFPKSISDETKAKPKCINLNPIILVFVFFGNSSRISILRMEISNYCSVLWNQLNSNSTL